MIDLQQQKGSVRQTVQQCFKLMKLEGKPQELFVPGCVQFKIRNFTQVNFENLTATANGVLCISFFVFTENENLRNFLCHRLNFNPQEEKLMEFNRRKKMQRGNFNYLPVMFNKDINVKLPTTRSKQFEIQSYSLPIRYKKRGMNVKGIRIYHIIRKEFNIEIKKSAFFQTFLAPFNFINLQLLISIDHMEVAPFQFQQKKTNSEAQQRKEKQLIRQYNDQQDAYMLDDAVKDIKKLSFNLLRIEEPFRQKLQKQKKVESMAHMIAYSCENSYGKYDLVETQLQAYTHDERQLRQWQSQQRVKKQLFQDIEPNQLNFKPFKYAVFKIPLFRYPIVDMMTIFIPLWLLSFVSVYIYFQTTEISTRIVNVAALMIAYAAIQPILRQNLPQATTITFVDVLIYSQLLINILFIVSSINARFLYDSMTDKNNNPNPLQQTNFYYDRWGDSYFIASLVISIGNVVAVIILILIYLCKKGGYRAQPLPSRSFSISDQQNWTLSLLMERTFARYKQKLIFLD